MKIGSLVELVDDNNLKNCRHRIYPIKNKIYTIRAIRDNRNGVLLEEISNNLEYVINIYNNFEFCEPGFLLYRFRELQRPIANIEQHINENTLDPVLTPSSH